jgi:hypothetical protein
MGDKRFHHIEQRAQSVIRDSSIDSHSAWPFNNAGAAGNRSWTWLKSTTRRDGQSDRKQLDGVVHAGIEGRSPGDGVGKIRRERLVQVREVCGD